MLSSQSEDVVHVQVISTIPVLFNYNAPALECLEICMFLNDDIAATVAKAPKKFIGLATLPLQDPNLSVGELERCVNVLGYRGIQIGSHVNEWNLDARQLDPLWKVRIRFNVEMRGVGCRRVHTSMGYGPNRENVEILVSMVNRNGGSFFANLSPARPQSQYAH